MVLQAVIRDVQNSLVEERNTTADSRTGHTEKAVVSPVVFLCHSSGDKHAVRRLERRLRGDGFGTWLDEKELLPGEDWDRVIRAAVRKADMVIVLLSNDSTTKSGYVQKEVRYVLDIAEEQPEGAIFLIPARLEECRVPERLSALHYVDIWKPGGYKRLLAALRKAQASRQ
jgi:TIR domain